VGAAEDENRVAPERAESQPIDPAALLRAVGSELSEEPVELLSQQRGKAVWAVGARHVLRVATDEFVRTHFARERRLLDRLIGRTTLAIPRPVFVLPEVLLHDDFSYHNAGFDTEAGDVLGIFDFTYAAVGDPHRDLRYAYTFEAEDMIGAYERGRGVSLDRARLRALHAWSALGALAWDLLHGRDSLLPLRWGWVDAVAAWDRSFLRALPDPR
jgi:hypothetical protein